MKKIIAFLKSHWKILLIGFSILVVVVGIVSCIDRPIINNYKDNSGGIQTHTFIHEEVDSSTVYKK